MLRLRKSVSLYGCPQINQNRTIRIRAAKSPMKPQLDPIAPSIEKRTVRPSVTEFGNSGSGDSTLAKRRKRTISGASSGGFRLTSALRFLCLLFLAFAFLGAFFGDFLADFLDFLPTSFFGPMIATNQKKATAPPPLYAAQAADGIPR